MGKSDLEVLKEKLLASYLYYLMILMKKDLKKLDNSCYEIKLVTETADHEKAKKEVLKHFQMDLELPGFRKWFVPIDMVKEHINPEYLVVWEYESLVNIWLQEVLKENPNIRFIGEPYDFKQDKKDEDIHITLKLDVFPEVEVLNDDWKKAKMEELKLEVADSEIDDALVNIKKNYAEYKDTETISLKTISKVSFNHLDKDGQFIDKWSLYIWEQEFNEDKFFVDNFVGKKKDEEIEFKYDEKKLPIVLHSKKSENNSVKVVLKVDDVKEIVLPEFTPDLLEKMFGNDEIKDEAGLRTFIKATLSQQKYDTELVQSIEKLLQDIRKNVMKISIPNTLVEEEFKSRMQSLESRFGGKDKIEEYFKQMWEDKAKQFADDIKKAASDSLEKFFILQKVGELLELDIDRQNPNQGLEIEKKIYDKLTAKPIKA